MDFPHLIFDKEIPVGFSDGDIISDLKLDLIFSEDVSRFLLLKPEKNTLLLRREAFKNLLADPESSKKLSELIDDLGECLELYRAMTAAQSEKAAAYIFAFLMRSYAHFCTKAAALVGYGTLFDRFAHCFEQICADTDFADAYRESQQLCQSLAAASSFTMKTDGESAVIRPSRTDGISASLKACAAELEIPIKERAPFSFVPAKSIAQALSTVYPEQFAPAVAFISKYRTKVSGQIFDYLDQLKFVYGIIDFTRNAEKANIPYCFPSLCEKKYIELYGVYDVTLLKKGCKDIVPNDVVFTEDEPFFFLTGANGGGKTTYLRAVGSAILMFLAGAPVFCQGGQACLLSAVFTHFPRDERFEGTGRFLDEKKRVDAILEKQDGNAMILLNETFSTTGEEKAIEQTDILANTLYKSGSFGLYITHQHDVNENKIPFLGVTVDENDSNRRTYRIEKRRLAPRSFAKDILEKYHLDKASLDKRF